MILGVGIDIIEVERIAKAMQNAGFGERVFTEGEREYIARFSGSALTAAGMFAAKEAVVKALGTGFNKGVGFKDVEITHDENGKPGARLTGGAQAVMQGISGRRLHISISHIKQTAVAQAILED